MLQVKKKYFWKIRQRQKISSIPEFCEAHHRDQNCETKCSWCFKIMPFLMLLQKPLRNFYFYCCFFSCTRKYLLFSRSAQTRPNFPLSYCNVVSQIYDVFVTKLCGKSKEGILCINSSIIVWTCWYWLHYFKPPQTSLIWKHITQVLPKKNGE